LKASLPTCVLLPPAMLALKSLQAWCLGSPSFESQAFRRRLDPDGKSLVDVCQALRRYRYRDSDIYLLNNNMHLEKHTEHMSHQLPPDVLFQLALLTWHFDASSKLPSRELFLFFEQPNNQFRELCKILCDRYNAQDGKHVVCPEFTGSIANNLGSLEYSLKGERNFIRQCYS
jgi:hypothetical protein